MIHNNPYKSESIRKKMKETPLLMRESVRAMRVLCFSEDERRRVITSCYSCVGKMFLLPYELPRDLLRIIQTGKRGEEALELLDNIISRRDVSPALPEYSS